MYNHNKAQQSKNRVHISWDILYKYYIHYEVLIKLLIHFQTSMVQPLKFGMDK